MSLVDDEDDDLYNDDAEDALAYLGTTLTVTETKPTTSSTTLPINSISLVTPTMHATSSNIPLNAVSQSKTVSSLEPVPDNTNTPDKMNTEPALIQEDTPTTQTTENKNYLKTIQPTLKGNKKKGPK